ncbi:MAG: hypothetical protein JO219_13080 [Candidatus Eremiobacteraeota bacterium]|nr:hypothetical protein [Candidatus Eremiobacteraeota bacterium]
MRAAIISAGTNSCRLLIARVDDTRQRSLTLEHHDIRGTRLGQGIAHTRSLDPNAIRRTLDAIAEFARLATRVDRLFIIGTCALREAANAAEFAARVKDIAGTDLRILTGEEEARASFDGARWALARGGRKLNGSPMVADIGGGSTEIATRERVTSLPVGAVRLTEGFIKHDPPQAQEIGACRTAVRVELDRAPLSSGAALVFVGGTADTAARMLHAYDSVAETRIADVRLDDLEDLLALVSSLPLDQRKRLHALPESRADIFPAGLVIVSEVARRCGVASFIVSEGDLLVGYLCEHVAG